jgi:hypothetical protein
MPKAAARRGQSRGTGSRPTQPEISGLEALGLVHLRRDAEPAIQGVIPAVIGAEDRARPTFAVQEARAAVAAGVGEGPDTAVLVAHDRNRNAGEVEGEVAAGPGQPVSAADEVPHLGENVLDFAAVKASRGIRPGRQRVGFEQGPANAGEMARRQRLRGLVPERLELRLR